MTNEMIVYTYKADTRGYQNSVDGAEKSNRSFISSTTVMITAVAGAVAGMGKMVGMASNLDEAMNVVQVSLGSSSDAVIKWSEDSIQSMGISQTEALKTAGVYANMATSLGFSQEEAAKMSMEMTQLTADLASFNNVSQEQAAIALKGVFTGETEALKEYGIMIDVATLKQYGYNENMTQAEKVQIRYKAVLDQTTNAQGDFIRTSDGMANQTRILKEQIKQLGTEIGAVLLPYFLSMAHVLNDVVAVAIGLVSGETSNLSDSQMALYTSITNVVSKISEFVGQMVGFVTSVFQAVTQSSIFQNSLLILKDVIGQIITFIKFLIEPIVILSGLFLQLVAQVIQQLSPALAMIGALFLSLQNALMPVFDALANLLIPVFGILINVFSILFSVLTPIINFVLSVVVPVISFLANIISAVLVVAINVLSAILNGLNIALNVIANVFKFLANIINTIVVSAFAIVQGVVSIFNQVLQQISGVVNKLGAFFSDLAGIITGVLNRAFQIIIEPIKFVIDLFNDFMKIIKDITNAIGSFFGSISEGLNKVPGLNKLVPGNATFTTNQQSTTPNTQSQSNVVNNFNIQANEVMNFRQAYRSARAAQISGGYTL